MSRTAPVWAARHIALLASILVLVSAHQKALTPLRDEVGGVHVSLSTSFMDKQACGFMNQHMKLLVLLTLAIHMRVDEVIVPAVVHRKAYEHQTVWQAAAPDTLWDLDSISNLLMRHGIGMSVNQENKPNEGALLLPSYFLKVLPLPDLDATVRRDLRTLWAGLSDKPVRLFLWAPDLMLALQTFDLPLYADVAAQVAWTRSLVSFAAQARSSVLAVAGVGRYGQYNGLHLRVEGDVIKLPLVEGHLSQYAGLMTNASYSGGMPLYVASGLYDKGRDDDPLRYDRVKEWLARDVVGGKLASVVVTREALRAQRQWGVRVKGGVALGGGGGGARRPRLHSEQRALVDFLVLCGARNVVGTWFSSFSYGLREWRAMLVRSPRNTTSLGFVEVSGRFERGMGIPVGPDVAVPGPIPSR